jgi:hypothetical protein
MTVDRFSDLERTHTKIADILGPDRSECFEAAAVVEKLRHMWRPDRVRIVLLAESHVWTSREETLSRVVQPDGVETGFARFVYCLGGGEPQIVTPSVQPNAGAAQYWKLHHDSVSDGYQRAMALRKAQRVASGIIWSKEREKRDSWPRAWKWLERFGDCDPRTIEPEHFLRIDAVTGKPKGLVAEIEAKVSVTERHMVIKVWRALWKKMAGMKYCDLGADPSKTFTNTPPKPREQVWYRREVRKLVQVAWRHEFYGLASLMAVAWDSQLSPIDNRSLSLSQARSDDAGIYFAVDRAKTGKAAVATLSPWSQAILVAYLNAFGADLLDTTPLFWTRGGRPVSRDGATGQWGGDHGGGRHIPARPYTKSRSTRTSARCANWRSARMRNDSCRTCAAPVPSKAMPAGARSKIRPTRWRTRSTATSSSGRHTTRSTGRASNASMRHGPKALKSWNKGRPKVSQRRPL